MVLCGIAGHGFKERGTDGSEVRIIPDREQGVGFSGFGSGSAAPEKIKYGARGEMRGIEERLRSKASGSKEKEEKRKSE
jgi:hypothetical protein